MKTAAILIAAVLVAGFVCLTSIALQQLRSDTEVQISKLRLQQTCELTRSVLVIPHAIEGATEADRPSVWRPDVAER